MKNIPKVVFLSNIILFNIHGIEAQFYSDESVLEKMGELDSQYLDQECSLRFFRN